MARRITSIKSRNLLGETKAEERKRLKGVVIKSLRKEGIRSKVLERSSLLGATKSQLANRREILKKAGLPGQKPRSIKERRRFL